MIDPLEFILWHLLESKTSVAATELCPNDEQRAERVMTIARMYQWTPGQWAPTASTKFWSARIRHQIENHHQPATKARRAGRSP